ncbi:hypothetical protein GWK47_052309 [Chionoecetes opilio]|uniref:Gag-like protein n=1 Tax=Chionoecetes opilio TaxID=41210 RepID=A0A8J5CRH9_CHIOP|nr:hypothetical protein GWK47_052309 [Chionoecetes opilio]
MAVVLRPPTEASCEVVSGATPKQGVLSLEELIARALASDTSVGLEEGDGAELRQGEGDADGYANLYLAVLALQWDLPGLQMYVRPNLKGEYILTPKDDASTDRMCGLAQERDAPARLVLLDPAERHTKAVLQRYSHDMPLEAVRDHPSVISAGRLRAVRDRAPTRQVLVELIGAAPDRLDLGPWGKYSMHHYEREPLRCYRCQWYNHLQGRCQHPVRGGVCSQAHASEQCIRRHKA